MAITRVTPDLIQVANNVTSTTVGNTTSIPSLTFDASGVIIAASNTTVTVSNTNITGNIVSSQIQTDVVLQGNVTLGAVTFPDTDGTSGQTLVTNGSGALSFATPTSGFVFLSTADLSAAATADFTLPAGYDAYQFVLGNVIPANDNVDLLVRTSTDGGSTFDAGAGDYDGDYILTDGTSVVADGSGLILVEAVGSGGAEDGVSGLVTVLHPHLAFATNFVWSLSHVNAASADLGVFGGGKRDSYADVDAVRFLFEAGNIESGTITMYGMKNS